MSLNVLQWFHGQTTKNRSATGRIRTEGGATNSGQLGVTASFGGVIACGAKYHAGADSTRVGRWTGNCAATPVWFSSAMPLHRRGWPKGLGWKAPRVNEFRRGVGVPSALGRASAGRWSVGVVSDSGGAGAALGTEGGRLSRIPVFSATWVNCAIRSFPAEFLRQWTQSLSHPSGCPNNGVHRHKLEARGSKLKKISHRQPGFPL